MQVTETQNEGLKRAYTMILTARELDAKVAEKLKEAQPDVEMKGFRKGKVPLALLKKQFGQKVLGEAMQESVDDAMKAHFEQKGERPAFEPDVKMANDAWKEGDDVEIEMRYEALPDVPEVDFKAIRLERLVTRPDEASVDEALNRLAENAQDFTDREDGAAAENGDQVVIDFVGRVDGEAFDGGAAEDYPLVLGGSSFIPGFEEQLVGARAGDAPTVTVTFPEDYQAKHLAGKDAVFDCTVKAVKQPVPAMIDDDLAQKYGSEDLEALRTQIRERLTQEYAGAGRALLKRQLLDALDEAVSFDLPPTMVETEARQVAHQLWHEENPEVEGHDHPEIEVNDEHGKLAERRVRLGLLLADLGQKAEIEVTDAEMTQAVMTQARQYPGHEREFFEFVQKNAQARQQLRAPIFEDKVVDYVLELADVSERGITKDELEKAVAAMNDEDA